MKAYKTYFGKKSSKKLGDGYVLSDFSNVARVLSRSSSDSHDSEAIIKQLDKQRYYRGSQSTKVGIKTPNKNKVGLT
jgi:hypothetical protein